MGNTSSFLKMASVKKHLPLLQLIRVAKPKLRKSILSNCDLELIQTIDECIFNTLNGNIQLTESEKKNLKKFKCVLRKVLNAKGGLNNKKKIISQSGGSFLPTLLQPIVAAGVAQFLNKEK